MGNEIGAGPQSHGGVSPVNTQRPQRKKKFLSRRSRSRGEKNNSSSLKPVFGVVLLALQLIASSGSVIGAESKASWQAEWDKTVRAAEQEGQLTVSIGGYGAIIDSGVFQKAYPKIKLTHITGAGTDLTQRIT